jgi:(S)-citramalyl-CoA lyase
MFPRALASGTDIVCVELNEVFTPTADEIARARRIIDTFEEADTGLVVIDGKLIEKPVLRDMYRILAIAERIQE